MPKFNFSAKSLTGEEINGSREVKDKFELAQSLRADGFVLVNAEEASEGLILKLPSFLSRISLSEKMFFARNLAVMVKAGLPLSRGLDILANQTSNPKFKEVLGDLSNSIRKGENFADALGKHPKVFSQLFRAMVASGEKTGKLDDSLKLIAHQLKRDYTLKKKIRGAMMYPAIIIFAMVVIGVLMLIYVVPTLVSTFEELEVELPRSTKVVISLSDFFVNNYILAPFLVIALVAGLYFALKSRHGRLALDFILLKIPVISGLVIETNAARTCRTLGSLLGSGVDIVEAFNITEDVLVNHYYKDVIRDAKNQIQKGSQISKVFIENSKLYPILVGEMMSVGEETGKLSEMLFNLAIFYENEVSSKTKDLSTIIEPVLMIIIGIVVGFFAVSMISPLYNLSGAF